MNESDGTRRVASLDPGNTKQGVMPKKRHWQLTLNEVSKYKQLKEYLTDLSSLSYFISCEEVAPTTGHKHIHIYV